MRDWRTPGCGGTWAGALTLQAYWVPTSPEFGKALDANSRRYLPLIDALSARSHDELVALTHDAESALAVILLLDQHHRQARSACPEVCTRTDPMVQRLLVEHIFPKRLHCEFGEDNYVTRSWFRLPLCVLLRIAVLTCTGAIRSVSTCRTAPSSSARRSATPAPTTSARSPRPPSIGLTSSTRS